MSRIAQNSRRSRTSCSILALATVMAIGATPAAAQSFNGTGVFNSGTGTITTGAGTTNIALTSQNSVITWTPTDNATGTGTNILFQNSGTTATFSRSTTFAVLNKIIPADIARAIVMNGTVNSRVNGVQGGSVYFYSPSGFVFGATSVFSVGSLVVSALPITVDGSGNFITNAGTDNTVIFGQALNPNATIVSGGSIHANIPGFGVGGTAGDSYVALVAPHVVHSGTGSINVNGSAALVAAEAATISFSTDGLFDIQVTTGTTSSSGVEVYGDIGGPTPTDSTDKQGVYLVAVPKNQLLTMVIGNGADLGFTLAGSAAIDDNGAVVLSAGHDIANGQIGAKSAGHGTGTGSFWFTGAHATNNFFGEATGSAYLYSIGASQPTTTFDNDVTVHAGQLVHMSASGAGTSLTVGGDVNLSTDAYATSPGGSATGGTTTLFAQDGGTVTINGYAYLSADGYGGSEESPAANGGNGTGGLVSVQGLSGGTVHVVGNLSGSASGFGGTSFDGNGGTGTGGTVQMFAQGGSLTIDSALSAYAQGLGGGAYQFGMTSGNGTGGLIQIRALAAGTFSVDDGIFADASGFGGFTAFQVNGGNGQGGDIQLQAQGGNATLNAGDDVTLIADGEAGSGGECISCGGIGGDGTGGEIIVGANNGSNNLLTLPGTLSMTANGYGGVGVNAEGGTGTGGHVQLYAADGSTVSLADNLYASADGYGGEHVEDGYGGDLPALAGDGTGGLAEVLTYGTGDPQLLLASNAFVHADGYGGGVSGIAGGTAGDGTGGSAYISSNLGDINIDGNAVVSAEGHGGSAPDGTGGDGTGDLAMISAVGGDVTIGGSVSLTASGFGGNGDAGGDGFGGGEFMVNTDGAHLYARNGDIVIGGSATVQSEGWGGDGANGGDGGDGTGGYATIHAANSNIGPSSITIDGVESSAFVSSDGHGGDGGDGDSGNTGGNGGAGGTGTGGFSGITAAAGNGHVDIAFAELSSQGFGGAGGNGGNGDGGPGGNGGSGGDAFGGHINVGTESGAALATGSNLGEGHYGSIIADASATGGRGGDGNFGATDGNGGAGGNAEGGTSVLLVRGSLVEADTVQLVANATGGDGGSGGGDFGAAGAGGDAESDEAAVIVTGRYLIPAQRGTLDAGTITATVISTGGSGSTSGESMMEGGSGFIIENSDATIGSVDFNVSAEGLIPDLAEDAISIVNGDVTVANGFSFATDGHLSFYIDDGSLTADSLTLSASDFVTNGSLPAPTNRGTAFADTASITTGNNFIADADFDIGSSLVIDAPGLISAHHFTIDGDLELIAGGNITLNNAISSESVEIDAGGNVNGGNLTAGDTVEVAAVGSVTVGNLSAGLVNPSSNEGADYVAAILAGGNIVAGNIAAAQHIGLATPGTMTTGTINAGGIFMALGTGNMSFGNASAGSEMYLADFSMMELGGAITDEFDPAPILASAPTPTGGSITIGNVTTGKFTAAAGTNLTTGTIDSDTAITLAAGAAITTLDLTAGDFVLANGGSITTGDIDADSVAMTSTAGNITSGDVFAFGDVELDAFGDILTGDITAGSIDLLAGDDITTGDLTTQFLLLLAQDGGITTQLFPGASITLEAGGDIATGNIDSIDGVYADAGGSLTAGTIDANDFVKLHSVGNMTTGDISAGAWLFADAGGTMTLGDLDTGYEADLFSSGNMAFGDANTGDELDFESGGSVTGGNVVAGSNISGEAAGAVSLGNLTAGVPSDDDFAIGIEAVGNITVGDASGEGHVGFATQGNLVTGNLSSPDLVMTLVGGNTTINGSITTDEGGQVYMADDSMFVSGGGNFSESDDDFDASNVLALDPVATGGSITINGSVTTGLFDAAAGTGLTTQAINASGDIHASAGGTAILNGVWNSGGEVNLASNDIDISNTGGINAADSVGLFSTNATQALIGDGLSGTGYALSNAEFGRISGYDVGIGARGDASAAIDMLIGDLSVTGPLAGSTIEGADGVLAFAVGDIDSETVSGVIRVVGDINATGFGANNSIEFYATRFELDAATGSISIFSSGSTLGGELGLYADRIHVAEGAILDQLAANPTYTGYQEDLNEAAAVQRPEGVLRADTLWIESDNLQDVLIQNTGTGGSGGTPAGFLVRQAFVNEDVDTPSGSVNLIINGQVVTEGGTLTGVEARDELVGDSDTSGATANSTINGCPLTGPCIIRPPAPPPTANVVDNQIDLITGNQFGDSEFDDNQDGDGGGNPISPPQPLFDTRPLIPSSDVNDPVSGTGNPALLGTAGDCEDDEDTQCGTKKEGSQ